MSRNAHSPEAGFSRLELVFTLTTLLLLAVVALPVLANTRARSEQVACLSNLRKIGSAVHLWGNDHGDRTPWFTPVAEGGTREDASGNPLRNNAYFQIGVLSNELVTPKVLVCPSDVGVGAPRKMANDFSANVSNGGFFALGYRNNSLSYFVGLHAYFWLPRSLLSGDRNIHWDFINNGCSVGVSLVNGATTSQPRVFWTNSIHEMSGNLLLTDGGVESVSIGGLRRAIQDPYTDNGSVHTQSP